MGERVRARLRGGGVGTDGCAGAGAGCKGMTGSASILARLLGGGGEGAAVTAF